MVGLNEKLLQTKLIFNMNRTTIEQSQPMKPRKFAEMTGYSIRALDKQRNG